MATVAAKALMDQAATNRMEAAIAVLVERFGIERPAPRGVIRDRQLAEIAGREDMATLLERVVMASEHEPAPVEEVKPELPKEVPSGRQTQSRDQSRQAPIRQQAKGRR